MDGNQNGILRGKFQMTKILQLIAALECLDAGTGFTFTSAQKTMWDLDGNTSDFYAFDPYEFHKSGRKIRSSRGYGCMVLCGMSGKGLLSTFFTKGLDGKWYRNQVRHLGHPYSIINHSIRV